MESIRVYDTTLRDGTQGEEINFSAKDKLNIARRLDEIGVHYIEGGWPGSNPRDMNFFDLARKHHFQQARITAFGSTRKPGVKVAEDLLTANPDLDGIYAVCGPPAVGAIQPLKNAKVDFGKFILVGFDACCGEIEALKAGHEDATVAQFPLKMGELGIVTAAAAVRGQKVAPVVDTGTAIVTKDNADQFK